MSVKELSEKIKVFVKKLSEAFTPPQGEPVPVPAPVVVRPQIRS